MASVLSGGAPLTKSTMAGGIPLTRKEQFEKKRFGEKSRLMSFGRMHEPIDRAFNRYFTIGMSVPLKSIDKNFMAFFKFYKEARKSDLKHQGRGGFIGMFKEFTDFRLWKKIFGVARDPQIAALHQIRDILLATSGKEAILREKGLGLDPVEFWTGAPRALKGFFDKYKGTSGGFFGNLFGMVKGIGGEIIEEGKKEDKVRANRILGAKKIDINTKVQKDIAGNIKQQTIQTTEMAKDAKFSKFAKGDPKRQKSQMSGWLKAAGIIALATAFFGPKGGLAAAAGIFFLTILPKLLMKGLSIMFGFMKKQIMRPLSFLGRKAKGLFTGGKALKGGLAGKAGTKIGARLGSKVLGRVLGPAAFALDTFLDVRGARKQGEGVGGQVAAGFFGKKQKKGTSKGKRAMAVGGQALKWATLGATIGSVVPGVGTAIGAGVGAATGLVGSITKQLNDAGKFDNLKKHKKGIAAGTALAAMIPGVGLFPPLAMAIGVAIGPTLEKKASSVKKQILGFKKKITNSLTQHINETKAFFSKKSSFASKVGFLKDKTIEIIRGIASTMMGWVKEIWNQVKSKGKSLISMPGKLWSKVFNKSEKGSDINPIKEETKMIKDAQKRENKSLGLLEKTLTIQEGILKATEATVGVIGKFNIPFLSGEGSKGSNISLSGPSVDVQPGE